MFNVEVVQHFFFRVNGLTGFFGCGTRVGRRIARYARSLLAFREIEFLVLTASRQDSSLLYSVALQ